MRWLRRAGLCAAALVGVLIIIWCGVMFSRPYVRDFSGRTYDEVVAVAGGDFGLPRSASNIRFVASSVGLGGRAHVVKFTAPVEDCRNYALADFRCYDTQQGSNPAAEFTPVTGRLCRPTSFGEYGVRDLRWFDIETIEEGITLERDHTHRPFTWIDTRRGILYSLWTD